MYSFLYVYIDVISLFHCVSYFIVINFLSIVDSTQYVCFLLFQCMNNLLVTYGTCHHESSNKVGTIFELY